MRSILLVFVALLFLTCGSSSKINKRNKPYEYGWVPKSYNAIRENYERYGHLYECLPGETIASIGAGNGKFEVAVSCLVPGITWYLEEIDTSRLNQFSQVRSYFEKLKGDSIEARFILVAGTETETLLPKGIFDRVLLVNVFHEISERAPVMSEVRELLKPGGKLLIMERMGDKPGLFHGDCKFPKLYEPDFLQEMEGYGFDLLQNKMGEQVSQLKYYTFTLSQLN